MNLPFSIQNSIYINQEKNTELLLNLDFVPMLMRRRFSNLTKMFFSIAHALIGDNFDIPLFFISKYGEINRQFSISQKLLNENEVSPTSFSFSVFNTAPALFSIFSKSIQPVVAINCSENMLEIGLQTVLAFLDSQKKDKALLIIADETLPDEYALLSDGHSDPHAVGFLISTENPFLCLQHKIENQEKDKNISEIKKQIDFTNFISEKNSSTFFLSELQVIKYE